MADASLEPLALVNYVGRASGDRPRKQRRFHSMCQKEVVRQREIFLEAATFHLSKLVPLGEW